MMGAGNKVCQVQADTPWKKYDRFDEEGVGRSNGQIDKADLMVWAETTPLPLRYAPRTEIPKNSPEIYCGLFRLAMLRERFMERYVRPEQQRTQPLLNSERTRIRQELKQAAKKTKEAIYREAREIEAKKNAFWCFFGMDDYCGLGFQDSFSFEMSRVIEALVAAKEVSWSLDHATGELYGVGVDFDKVAGEPVVIRDLGRNDPNVGQLLRNAGLKPGMLVLAIEGKDTMPMSFKEALVAFRGPKDSLVSLSVQERAQKPFDVTLRRIFTPQALR